MDGVTVQLLSVSKKVSTVAFVGRTVFHSGSRHCVKKSLHLSVTSSGMGGGFFSDILNRHSISFKLQNGGSPVTSSIAMQPIDQTSTRKAYSSSLTISGAQYQGVPTVERLLIELSGSTLVAVPKSIILILALVSKRILSG